MLPFLSMVTSVCSIPRSLSMSYSWSPHHEFAQKAIVSIRCKRLEGCTKLES